VFYELGHGSLSLSGLRSGSETICYSPVTVLELAGKWRTRTFSERKNASAAILSSGAVELPDPDTYLTWDIFGFALNYVPHPMVDAVRAMAASRDMKSLVSGVPDLAARVIRRVSVPKIHGWRVVTEQAWVKEMLAIQQRTIPKFARWYKSDPTQRKKQVPRLTGKARDEFLRSTTTEEWALTLVVDCHHRALLGAKRNRSLVPTQDTVQTILAAITSIECYCAVYTHYLIRLLTAGALPKPNDSSDLELFLYAVDDDHVVVTSDKIWKKIADAAGFGARVRIAK